MSVGRDRHQEAFVFPKFSVEVKKAEEEADGGLQMARNVRESDRLVGPLGAVPNLSVLMCSRTFSHVQVSLFS